MNSVRTSREGRRIPVSGPSITQKEIDYVTDAVQNAWYENANVYNDKFEKSFADYIGVKYAISLPSCTSAIHLSLLALGVGPGDEVIVPDVTWIATSAPINYVGATPVFADIDKDSWCLSPESFESKITNKTRAVIPVDLYGNMPDMDQLKEIALKYNVAVIEDAAEAIGSEYKGRKAGSFGETGVFSFHGSKTMTTGEGGMLVTDREGLYRRSLFLRDHGRKPGDVMFLNEEVAYKYKMSSLQAALGLAQLERMGELVQRKREIFGWYKEDLNGIPDITLNNEEDGVFNSYWMVTAIVNPALELRKEIIIKHLEESGISVRPFFNPLSSLSAYRHLQTKNTVAYAISPYGINLPSGMNINRRDVKYICDKLLQLIN